MGFLRELCYFGWFDRMPRKKVTQKLYTGSALRERETREAVVNAANVTVNDPANDTVNDPDDFGQVSEAEDNILLSDENDDQEMEVAADDLSDNGDFLIELPLGTLNDFQPNTIKNPYFDDPAKAYQHMMFFLISMQRQAGISTQSLGELLYYFQINSPVLYELFKNDLFCIVPKKENRNALDYLPSSQVMKARIERVLVPFHVPKISKYAYFYYKKTISRGVYGPRQKFEENGPRMSDRFFHPKNKEILAIIAYTSIKDILIHHAKLHGKDDVPKKFKYYFHTDGVDFSSSGKYSVIYDLTYIRFSDCSSSYMISIVSKFAESKKQWYTANDEFGFFVNEMRNLNENGYEALCLGFICDGKKRADLAAIHQASGSYACIFCDIQGKGEKLVAHRPTFTGQEPEDDGEFADVESSTDESDDNEDVGPHAQMMAILDQVKAQRVRRKLAPKKKAKKRPRLNENTAEDPMEGPSSGLRPRRLQTNFRIVTDSEIPQIVEMEEPIISDKGGKDLVFKYSMAEHKEERTPLHRSFQDYYLLQELADYVRQHRSQLVQPDKPDGPTKFQVFKKYGHDWPENKAHLQEVYEAVVSRDDLKEVTRKGKREWEEAGISYKLAFGQKDEIHFLGVKGSHILSQLKFDPDRPPYPFNIYGDNLHVIYIGFLKRLLTKWFDPDNIDPLLKDAFAKERDECFTKCKLKYPTEWASKKLSLKNQFTGWKGNHFKTLICFVMPTLVTKLTVIPHHAGVTPNSQLFKRLMTELCYYIRFLYFPQNYYEVVKGQQRFLNIKEDFFKFMDELEAFMGPAEVTMNVHIFRHFFENTRPYISLDEGGTLTTESVYGQTVRGTRNVGGNVAKQAQEAAYLANVTRVDRHMNNRCYLGFNIKDNGKDCWVCLQKYNYRNCYKVVDIHSEPDGRKKYMCRKVTLEPQNKLFGSQCDLNGVGYYKCFLDVDGEPKLQEGIYDVYRDDIFAKGFLMGEFICFNTINYNFELTG